MNKEEYKRILNRTDQEIFTDTLKEIEEDHIIILEDIIHLKKKFLDVKFKVACLSNNYRDKEENSELISKETYELLKKLQCQNFDIVDYIENLQLLNHFSLTDIEFVINEYNAK